MIFKRLEIRREMQAIHREIDAAMGRFLRYLELERREGNRLGAGRAHVRLQAEANRLFEAMVKLSAYNAYGRVSEASKERRDFLFPYYGKGFVRYSVHMDFRRVVFYKNDGSSLEVRQMKNGFVVVDNGRYVQIKGLVMVEEQWKKVVEARQRNKESVR